MENDNWEIPDRPDDLRQRLENFACVIVRVVQYLHTCGPVAIALSGQILKSGTSAGANYEEADDGSSERDELAKRKITLRELKEARFRLVLLRRTGFLNEVHDPVIQESSELKRIVAKLVQNGEKKLKKRAKHASENQCTPPGSARTPRGHLPFGSWQLRSWELTGRPRKTSGPWTISWAAA